MPTTRRQHDLPWIFRPKAGVGPTIVLGFLLLVGTPGRALAQDGQVTPEVVTKAVGALNAADPATVSEVDRLLRLPEAAPQVLTALNGVERLPADLWRGVSGLTTPENPENVRLAATALLPRFGTREAGTRLVTLLDDGAPAVVEAARGGLGDLTGLDANRTIADWKAWGEESAKWSDRAWTAAVTTRLAARVRAQGDRQKALSEEVVSLYRRMHVVLDANGRTALLAELIRDSRAPLRDLGFELAGRDLSARTPLGPEVATAAMERLAHPDPATRAKAATLVVRLVPPDAMLALTHALVGENAPAAAEPMLLGVARWPNPEAVGPTLAWLGRPDAPIGAVATALWSLAQANLLEGDGVRPRVVEALRSRELVRIGEPGMKLLVRYGDENDLAKVAALLGSPEDPVRTASAGALAETRAGAELLIKAAGAEPRLFPPAARAIQTHMGTPEGLRTIAGLPTLDQQARDNAVAQLARQLDVDDLGPAVRSASLEPALSERILSRLLEPETDRTPGVIEGLVGLSEARVRLGRPALAIEALGEIDGDGTSADIASRARVVRLAVAFEGGDMGGAAQIKDATPGEWVDALTMLPDSSTARSAVATEIVGRFKDRLSAEQLERVNAIAAPGRAVSAP